MGNSASNKSIKSYYSTPNSEEVLEYKNKRFIKHAKKELYDLFVANKLVHRDVVDKLEEDLTKVIARYRELANENMKLKASIKRLNKGRRISPEEEDENKIDRKLHEYRGKDSYKEYYDNEEDQDNDEDNREDLELVNQTLHRHKSDNDTEDDREDDNDDREDDNDDREDKDKKETRELEIVIDK